MLTGKKRLLNENGESFHDEWNQVFVSEICHIGRGRVISKTEIEENKGTFPVYSSQTLHNGVMGYLNTYDFDGEVVTWTTDGVNAGTVFYRTGKFNCTNVCGTLTPKNKSPSPYAPLPVLKKRESISAFSGEDRKRNASKISIDNDIANKY